MADGEAGATNKPCGRHHHNRLTVPAINAAGPRRHADGNGLYLEVDDTGAKRWVLRTVVELWRKMGDAGLRRAAYRGG